MKDVDAAVFAAIRSKLESNAAWVSKSTTVTVDTNFAGGIRQTHAAGQPPQYLRKRRVFQEDVFTATGELVRFSVSREERLQEGDLPPLPPGDVRIVRVKTRHSYNHKGEVLFELTQVQSGASEEAAAKAVPEWEVELEWCGHAAAGRYAPDLLLRKFVHKVGDLVEMKLCAELAADTAGRRA